MADFELKLLQLKVGESSPFRSRGGGAEGKFRHSNYQPRHGFGFLALVSLRYNTLGSFVYSTEDVRALEYLWLHLDSS